jgi:hypothetical protein
MRQTIAGKSIQEGTEIGEKRRERRALLNSKQQVILLILELRFDSVPESVVKKVKSIRSIKRLDALLEKAPIASISEMELD